jgi:hypothetical protein
MKKLRMLVLVLVPFVFVAVYVWSYFGLSEPLKTFKGIRLYKYQWQAILFKPAAKTESLFRHTPISTMGTDEFYGAARAVVDSHDQTISY